MTDPNNPKYPKMPNISRKLFGFYSLTSDKFVDLER